MQETWTHRDAPTIEVRRYRAARAVLESPAFAVPAVPSEVPPGGMAWLRATVSRFSAGDTHQRRRAMAVAELGQLDPVDLRRDAAAETASALDRAASRPVEVMGLLARRVPVGVLARRLGARLGDATELVASVAAAYHPGGAPDPDADAAVARLIRAFGGHADESTAARIGLLVQACDATAGLIGNAVHAGLIEHYSTVEELVAEVLRHEPPVRATTRIACEPVTIPGVDIAAGTIVRIDLAAANRDATAFVDPDRFDPGRPRRGQHLAFGHGGRACPGQHHALALASGVIETILDRARAGGHRIEYGSRPNLRVPARLWVDVR